MEEAEGTKLSVSYRPLAVEYFPVPIKPNKLTHAYTTVDLATLWPYIWMISICHHKVGTKSLEMAYAFICWALLKLRLIHCIYGLVRLKAFHFKHMRLASIMSWL
jgi:hypothetical protein